MRVLRAAGQNISPSDDGSLFNQIFSDGLFEDASISSLGSNQVSISALYGIIQGREFTNASETINVVLPSGSSGTGYIFVEYDFATPTIGSVKSALDPFTPTYEDINSTGTLAQMIIAEYTATAVAVTDITPVYEIAKTHGSGNEIAVTLEAASWSNDLYTVTDSHISTDAEITLAYPPTLTDAQYEAYQDANIRPYGAVTSGSMTLKAVGGAPSEDLPMTLIVKR